MQSFVEFAANSFMPEIVLNWRLLSTRHAVASFRASTVTVEVSFEQSETLGPWHVGFQVTAENPAEGATRAFRIFSGVFQAIRDFIETREPEAVILAAKDEDLASIYSTYLRRESTRIEQLGYILEEPARVNLYTEFTLRRIRAASWKA